MIMNFIKSLLCKHSWQPHGWSYIHCDDCGKVRYDPKKNSELMEVMIESSPWTTEEKMRFRYRSAFKR